MISRFDKEDTGDFSRTLLLPVKTFFEYLIYYDEAGLGIARGT
jgi:hypothetical protein